MTRKWLPSTYYSRNRLGSNEILARNLPTEMSRISNDFILSGIGLILGNNTFHFNGVFCRLLKASNLISMGTKMAPMYATLTLGYLKKLYTSIYNNYDVTIYENFVKYYFRYLDDVLLIYDKRAMSIDNIN